MSKEKFLSYYKFTPAKWISGSITLCSYEAKGIFIDICALYWAREGILKEAYVEQIFNKCSTSVKQELFDAEVISYREGLLQIDFLEEQLNSFEGISEKRAEAGRKSAESRKKSEQNSTSVQQVLSKVQQTPTIKRREDKIIEEKIREEKKKEDKIIEEIIDDLNQVCSTNYKYNTPKTKELIKTRIKEGFTVEDFKKVHRNMFDCWYIDEKMREFLRPITLYSNKFESYLNKLAKNEFDKYGETGKQNIKTIASWLSKQEENNVE